MNKAKKIIIQYVTWKEKKDTVKDFCKQLQLLNLKVHVIIACQRSSALYKFFIDTTINS